MAGNSRRRGAVRKRGKDPTVGSGGQRRKGLEGKGPTPKAVDREHHPAHRRATATRSARPGGYAGGSRRPARRSKGAAEVVAGRNAVVEALRARHPGDDDVRRRRASRSTTASAKR